MQRRRSNIEIIGDMLRIGANGTNGAGKTEIMYSANMSYSQLQKYLSMLINQGFVDRLEVGNPMVTYRVTERGSTLLRSIDTILDVLEFKNSSF